MMSVYVHLIDVVIWSISKISSVLIHSIPNNKTILNKKELSLSPIKLSSMQVNKPQENKIANYIKLNLMIV
jgi:hypothetical protein